VAVKGVKLDTKIEAGDIVDVGSACSRAAADPE